MGDWWMIRNRWMMMAAGMWIMCCSGSSYLYSEYSESIKDALHYDQETLDTVGFFKELGESVGLLSGLLYDVWPTWAVFLLGACQVSGGYLMAFLSVSGMLASPSQWTMAFYLCVGANGQTFFITAVLVSVVKRFPLSRGMIIGIMKGLIGLSAAVLTQFQHALNTSADGLKMLLFLSWFPSLVVLLLYVFFEQRRTSVGDNDSTSIFSAPEFDENESLYLSLFAGTALVLAAFLMGIIMVQNTTSYFPPSVNRGVCLITFLLLLLPLRIVIASRSDAKRRRDSTSNYNVQSSSSNEPHLLPPLVESLCPSSKSESENGNVVARVSSETSVTSALDGSNLARINSFQHKFPARGEDHTLWQALSNGDFWLLVAIAGIGLGSGLTAMDNVGQVGASLGYSEAMINSFVSMVSIWNFMGRLGAGVVSEICLHEKGIPRPVFIMFALTTLSLGHTIMALALPGSLYFGSVMIGLSFGAQWSLIPGATSELFGLRNFGTLLNAVTMASPLGSYILSVCVAGYLYDAEARKQNLHSSLWGSRRLLSVLSEMHFPTLKHLDDANQKVISCRGAVCFRLTFFIMAGICIVGSLLSAILVVRTRKYYAEVVYESCQLKRQKASREGLQDFEQPAEDPKSSADLG